MIADEKWLEEKFDELDDELKLIDKRINTIVEKADDAIPPDCDQAKEK